MKIQRRQFLNLAAGAAAVPAVSRIANAQTYPTGPVKVIVGFAAGGGADIMARLMGPLLSERLREQFFVENRTGARSKIAADGGVKAAPDGCTRPIGTATHAVN